MPISQLSPELRVCQCLLRAREGPAGPVYGLDGGKEQELHQSRRRQLEADDPPSLLSLAEFASAGEVARLRDLTGLTETTKAWRSRQTRLPW